MTELKCPFCQQELNIDPCGEMGCLNDKCKKSVFLIGTKELWQALINTKKKLDIALKELKASDRYYQDDECIKEAIKKIEQINRKESQ